MYQRILVPTDGSDTVAETLEHATELATDRDATVHGLYVLDRRLTHAAPAETRPVLRGQLEVEGEQALADLERTVTEAGLDVVTSVAEGRPSKEIRSYADEHDIDLIVIGTHGKGPREKLTSLGSVSERVVNTSSVPVLVVRNVGQKET